MLADGSCFLEDADLHVAEAATGFVVRLDHPRQRDRSSEAGRTATDEENIHRDCLGIGRVGENEPVEWKRRLVDDW